MSYLSFPEKFNDFEITYTKYFNSLKYVFYKRNSFPEKVFNNRTRFVKP